MIDMTIDNDAVQIQFHRLIGEYFQTSDLHFPSKTWVLIVM